MVFIENGMKAYLVKNKDINAHFLCDQKSMDKLLSRGSHFECIGIRYVNSHLSHKLTEGYRLPPKPLEHGEINDILTKYSRLNLKGKYNVDEEFVEDISKLMKEVVRARSEVEELSSYLRMKRVQFENMHHSIDEVLDERLYF